MKLKEPKKNRPPRSGPPSDYGPKPSFCGAGDFSWVVTASASYSRPAQMRALARWILRCADWLDEQKGKEK